MSQQNLLEVRDLSVEFGRAGSAQRVVDGVDLSLAPGETFALVGESGSGKSVTASAVLGLLPATARVASGSIRLRERELLGLRGPALRAVRGSQIGMIFQNPLASLDPSFKVGSQIEEIIALHRPSTRRRHQREIAETWLRNVGIADTGRVLGAYPHELSGGMRQRVMIAIAALSQPAVLIADEPTTALDAVIQKQILDLLRDVVEQTGSALLLITHDFGVVSHLADRVAVMQHGRVVETGPRREVLGRPAHDYTRSLIAAVPEIGGRTRPPRARLDGVEPAAEPVVRLSGVTRGFQVGGVGTGQPRRRFTAVDDVSLTIGRGEVFGLIGESGSGKSTIARLIGGLQPVTSGSVHVVGHEISALPAREVRGLRPRFQFVFQDATSSLNPRIRVGEQIARPLLRLGRADSRRDARRRTGEVLEQVALPGGFAERYPHELSGGQRQRIGIARALALEPDLLILDEPTSALDVSTQARILDLLLDLQRRLGLTYLFIGHNLAVIENVCDRVGVLERGRLLETFDVADLHDARRHPTTRALLDAVLPLDRGLAPAAR